MRYVVPVLARIVTAVLGFALIAGGAIVVIEIVAAWLGTEAVVVPDDLRSELATTNWDERPVPLILFVIGLVGLLALALGLARRPPLTVSIDVNRDIELERASLEQSITRQLEGIDGISGARVRSDTRRVKARLETHRRTNVEALRTRARDELVTIERKHRLRLRPDVTLRARERAS